MYIAIAGNIGSGKTTLTNLLAQHYRWKKKLECVDENPYLDDYYHNLKRWSFNMEVFFLKQRFHDLIDIQHEEETVIQDRSIFEGVYVFAANNKRMGNMDDRDFETYMELFDQMMSVVQQPKLMLYLRSSVPHLVNNIQKRGRSCEQQIPIEYLENLNELYEDFIFNKYKGDVMVIDVDNIDYLNNPKDLSDILERLDARMFGLFSK